MLKAVIFDLDGTLLDTLDDLVDSCNKTLTELNMPQRSKQEIQGFVGNGLGVLMELAIPNGKENPFYKEALSLMRKNYAENSNNKTKPYSGIMNLLQKLNQNGIKTGIVSNKPDAQVKELTALYFNNFIEQNAATGENEACGIKRKPAPDSVFKVMENLGTTKEETVYVGDSEVDIETAKNAGLKCISVCWGFKTEAFLKGNGASVLVHTPEEILKINNLAL